MTKKKATDKVVTGAESRRLQVQSSYPVHYTAAFAEVLNSSNGMTKKYFRKT